MHRTQEKLRCPRCMEDLEPKRSSKGLRFLCPNEYCTAIDWSFDKYGNIQVTESANCDRKEVKKV